MSDDENDQAATNDAFEVLHYIARKRLATGKLTAVDATNIRPEDRRPLATLAREFHCLPVAFVLDVPKDVCIERNRDRPDRNFGPRVLDCFRLVHNMVKAGHALCAPGIAKQPALKCRGREYLRIIYGPEYTADENLARPRSRALATKRSLALREFVLGIERLERFVRKEPLRRIHECVFGVLALESEPVDPRL